MQQTLLNQRYELGPKIGEGGMASVYRGRDIRLNRRVAIKILHSHYVDDPEFLTRFQHEAQAAAVLTHPSVVDVFDVGQDGSNHYIVMEYVDGENLKTLILREAPLPVAQAVAIAEAVAYGLDSAHRVGMVHRDIKPQNIMITGDGHIRITDFGIAKSDFSSALTQTGITFGTADYISPEQASGQSASHQSDLYGLGVTLYEMLTGRLPFVGDSAVSVATQHVSAYPPAMQQFNPQIPTQLEALIMRTLAKDPAERPHSAREFAQMLRQYRDLAGQQTAFLAQAVTLDPHGSGSHGGGAPPPDAGNGPGRGAFPPPRANLNRAPQDQSQGCGVFVVGLIVLVSVLGLVLLFGTGVLPPLIGEGSASRTSPSPIPAAAILTQTPGEATAVGTPAPGLPGAGTPTSTTSVTVSPTASTSPTPSASPTPSPTPSLSPTPSPTASPVVLVTVPDIRNLPENTARSELNQLGLIPVSGGARNDNDVAEGSVIDQAVAAGNRIRQGDRVTYTLSLGPEFVEIPDVVQLNINVALAELQERDLLVEVVQEPSTQVSENFVIRQEPLPGARVQASATIFLTVSVGDKVRFPAVVGTLLPEARQLLSINGINLELIDEQGPDRLPNFSSYRPNEVVSAAIIDGRGGSQPVQNGDFVPRNSDIILGVRKP